ncbi:MAG: hypothetical protein GY903_21965 [Fuerstiella sp.]|nr:hypothetical protein [Fuerstiella sp.]MCP4857158.1 hypothetical protein [Fuerstiella sp.]
MNPHRLNLFVVFAGLVSISVATLIGAPADEQSTSEVAFQRDAVEVVSIGSRFNRLTSEVWRYGQQFQRRDLQPVPANNPHAEPQPLRDRPERLALSADGTKLYVTLAGTEAVPGHEIAVIDVATETVLRRVPVGLRPYVPVLHPDGRFLVVTNELSNYATVIDTKTDKVTGEIPVDYYCQGLAFAEDGKRAWIANRYLDQVLVVQLQTQDDRLKGTVVEVGGFDDDAFFGSTELPPDLLRELSDRELSVAEIQAATRKGIGGINAILRAHCSRCHEEAAGGYVCGADPVVNFLSAVENSIGGQPYESPLIRAVVSTALGGFGDQSVTPLMHAGEVLFDQDDRDLERLVEWIRTSEGGPGIPVGNPGSHPKDVVLSRDGRHLFVGNTGTMDVSVVDVQANHEVGAIYVQNVAGHVLVAPDDETERDLLITLTMGIGFGAAPSRDPLGAETWDRDHPAAQFTVLRDPVTTDAFPIDQQHVMGPFEAVDGTWNIKMRDMQNDVVAVDLSRLSIPTFTPGMDMNYLLKANAYESHPGWVRYTSDTAEATTGDVKGDVPPELQRVHGAFPESAAVNGNRLYLTMAGTFEVVEWLVQPNAKDPAEKLVPLRTFPTGLRPVGIVAGADETPAAGKLYVANQIGESISIIDVETGDSRELPLRTDADPPLITDAERGELIVHSSVFTSDGDTSCLHCHYRDTGDGRAWGAAETVGQDRDGHLTTGGTLGIPQMRNVYAIQPYYFEGTHRLSEGQGADITEPASSIDFDRAIWAGDFTAVVSPVPPDQRRVMHEELKERVETRSLGEQWYDLEERRADFFRQQSVKYFGRKYELQDFYRFVSAWLGDSNHMLPNPYDQDQPSVRRGKTLFNSASVMCSVCHTPPEFTNKDLSLTHNERRALPPLTTISRRDASYTLISVRAMDIANGITEFEMEPDDRGRVEDKEGSFTTMQLRGIFDRPPVFLHHARTRSLREVLCTPEHPGLRRYRLPVLQGSEDVRPGRREIGFNETTARTPAGRLNPQDQTFDTHGGTSHLTARQIEDLLNFMLTIE